jgi:hypothetical protein
LHFYYTQNVFEIKPQNHGGQSISGNTALFSIGSVGIKIIKVFGDCNGDSMKRRGCDHQGGLYGYHFMLKFS